MAIEIVDIFPLKMVDLSIAMLVYQREIVIVYSDILLGLVQVLALNKNLRPKMRPVSQDPLGAMTQIWWAERLSGHWVAHWKYPVVFPAFHSGIEWPWIGAWYSPFLENSTWIGEICRTFRSIWQRFPVQFRKIQLVDPWMSDLLATSSILVA